MSEDSILMCLIAFVLGFLVFYMIRGDGLSVGGEEATGCDSAECNKPVETMKGLCHDFINDPSCPANTHLRDDDSKYCSDMPGVCRGPGGENDPVDGVYRENIHDRSFCESQCNNVSSCVGYDFSASNTSCFLYGSGLDGLQSDGGWIAETYPAATTTIASVKEFEDFVCAAKYSPPLCETLTSCTDKNGQPRDKDPRNYGKKCAGPTCDPTVDSDICCSERSVNWNHANDGMCTAPPGHPNPANPGLRQVSYDGCTNVPKQWGCDGWAEKKGNNMYRKCVLGGEGGSYLTCGKSSNSCYYLKPDPLEIHVI